MKKLVLRRRTRRFSLLEIMVVVVIIGLLAGLVITNAIGQGEEAKVQITKATLSQVGDALKLHKMKYGTFPNNEGGLGVLCEGSNPLLDKKPTDAWNHDIHYMNPGTQGAPFDVWSLGADGVEGGDGVNADIYFNREEKH